MSNEHVRQDEPLSHYMNDLITYRLHWFVRKGNIILMAVFLMLFAIAWLIQYPDRMNGSVKILASQSSYYGEMTLTGPMISAIKAGQPVLIKVESNPGSKPVYLRGQVEQVSSGGADEHSLLVKVGLSNYPAVIPPGNSIIAEATIIMDNRRLLDRFFGGLKQAISR